MKRSSKFMKREIPKVWVGRRVCRRASRSSFGGYRVTSEDGRKADPNEARPGRRATPRSASRWVDVNLLSRTSRSNSALALFQNLGEFELAADGPFILHDFEAGHHLQGRVAIFVEAPFA